MRSFTTLVLGAGGVGKSALTVRFITNKFLDGYDPTIEEVYQKIVPIGGELSSLEIIDTAGAEQFTTLNELYIKSADGFILVFSLSQQSTIREIDMIRQQIYRIKGSPPTNSHHHSMPVSGQHRKIPLVVVGTKSDLVNEREVTRETVARLGAAWGVPCYETSAKTDRGIREVFDDIVRQMAARYPNGGDRRKRRRHSGKCVVM